MMNRWPFMTPCIPIGETNSCFFARGRFMRGAGGCTGRYVLQDGLLTLFWDDWAPEALEKNGSGFSRGPFSLTPAAGSRQLPFPESVS